jgi:ribonuclease Z
MNSWETVTWSQAGIATMMLFRNKITNQHLLFDCGSCLDPKKYSKANNVFITHAHLDHCGAIFSHARSRWFTDPATYYVPKESLEDINKAKKAMEDADGSELNMNIIGVEPGSTFFIGKGLYMTCVKTDHRVPSVGYLIYREQKGLKKEYQGLSKEEKSTLGRSGINLTETVKKYEIAYSGDTLVSGIDPLMLTADICVLECTFISQEDKELATKTKHVFLDDLVAFVNNGSVRKDTQLILIHFSARYSAEYITKKVLDVSWPFEKKPIVELAAFSDC